MFSQILNAVPELYGNDLSYDRSGHLLIKARYSASLLMLRFIYGKPLWVEYDDSLRTLGLFGCEERAFECGQVTVCSSAKAGHFIARNALASAEKYEAINQISTRNKYYRDLWLIEAIERVENKKILLVQHKISIVNFGDDALFENAFGSSRPARRPYWRFVAPKVAEKESGKKYKVWIKRRAKEAVGLFEKSEIGSDGTRQFPNLEAAVQFVVGKISEMSIEEKVTIGFDLPDQNVFAIDVAEESLDIHARRLARRMKNRRDSLCQTEKR